MKFPASYSTQKLATYFKQRSPPAFSKATTISSIQPLGFGDVPIYVRPICRGYNLHLPSHCTSIEPAFFAIIAIPRGHGCLEIPEERSITSGRRKKALRSRKPQLLWKVHLPPPLTWNKALWSEAYENPLVSLNKAPKIGPLFLGGGG